MVRICLQFNASVASVLIQCSIWIFWCVIQAVLHCLPYPPCWLSSLCVQSVADLLCLSVFDPVVCHNCVSVRVKTCMYEHRCHPYACICAWLRLRVCMYACVCVFSDQIYGTIIFLFSACISFQYIFSTVVPAFLYLIPFQVKYFTP